MRSELFLIVLSCTEVEFCIEFSCPVQDNQPGLSRPGLRSSVAVPGECQPDKISRSGRKGLSSHVMENPELALGWSRLCSCPWPCWAPVLCS